MSPNPARLATALASATALALAAPAPALALFGHGNKAPESAKPDKAKPSAKATETKTGEAKPAEAAPVRKATPQERIAAERMEPLARAAFWSREAQVDPIDAEAGVKLAKALRDLGRYEEAVQAVGVVLIADPNNLEALLEDGRSKIAANQGFYAIETLRRASKAAPKDWRPVSLLGVALEQSQRPEEAKQAYDQALQLSPDNPAVLSNLALFYAGRGDPIQAEALLRRAVARPGAEAQERQNLALVLGLQGKLAEAERLIRQDLPPEVANANLAYLRETATAQPGGDAAALRNWGSMTSSQAKK